MAAVFSDVRFSNRPFGVKRFQTIHHCNVDVARGSFADFNVGIDDPAVILFSPSPLAPGAVALNPGLSEQRSAYEISRSPELHRAAADWMEACERALAVWPPFLRARAVSPPSFSPSPSAPRSSSRFMPS